MKVVNMIFIAALPALFLSCGGQIELGSANFTCQDDYDCPSDYFCIDEHCMSNKDEGEKPAGDDDDGGVEDLQPCAKTEECPPNNACKCENDDCSVRACVPLDGAEPTCVEMFLRACTLNSPECSTLCNPEIYGTLWDNPEMCEETLTGKCANVPCQNVHCPDQPPPRHSNKDCEGPGVVCLSMESDVGGTCFSTEPLSNSCAELVLRACNTQVPSCAKWCNAENTEMFRNDPSGCDEFLMRDCSGVECFGRECGP
jgi:hypothetical protein